MKPSPTEFVGRVAAVTGAGSGIGLEIARLLLAGGAQVAALDLDPAGAPAEALQLHLDVSDPAGVQEAFATISRELGAVDTLFANAGIGSTASAVDCTPEEWDRVFAVNVRGVFLCTRAVLPGMLARGSGCIVNTASVAGLIGLPDRAAYCASKGAVVAFTKQVAVQYASQGIRCNCICPGTVDSPWVGRLMDEAPDPAARREQLIARQPLGRLGTPVEVAQAAVYLATDAASFITGSALVIDGGITAA
ncbi:MAG: 2-keto-3-deoxy-L-fuconate dehydrogenase [Frankiales bacterium]|jgi:NAD(P)-dependent dehydrogenase (short-subunit alcohol dehydrogenase family)|nr:2-keto-3-deoxy-L-fuconate dehydrogenase [Frankiales bacterium]